MESSTNLRLFGCALNGPNMDCIRDICLRDCLTKLQKAGRHLTLSVQRPHKDSVATFRQALRNAGSLAGEPLCWRDRRMLERVLAHARTLNKYLPA